MRLKRELMDLRDEIFARPEEEVIVEDGAHITTEGEGQKDSEAKRAWDERARHLKQVR